MHSAAADVLSPYHIHTCIERIWIKISQDILNLWFQYNIPTGSSSGSSKSVSMFPDTARKSIVRYNIFIWLCSMCSSTAICTLYEVESFWLGQSLLLSLPGSPPSLASLYSDEVPAPLLGSYPGLVGRPCDSSMGLFFLTATIIQTFNMSADVTFVHCYLL